MYKKKRRRGIILTPEGLQEFQNARLKLEYEENFGERYTLEQLSERTNLDIHTINRIIACKDGVDKRSIERLFIAFHLDLTESCYSKPNPHKRQDWGEAVCVSDFYGRTEELSMLGRWVLKDACRLVTILAMGGTGKTALSIKLAEQIQNNFDCLIWRSLRDAPPICEFLANLIQFLSEDQENETNLPESIGGRISVLIEYLRSSRCFLVLDNMESLLCSDGRAGICREEYEGYGELLRRIGETKHQSCLVVTTREKLKEVAALEGENLPVRTLKLSGFKEGEGKEILKLKGLSGTEKELTALNDHYEGNALALKVVATTIRDLFEGNISEFLAEDTKVFGDIRDILEQQFARLSSLEQDIIYWLAINREQTTLSQLREDLVSTVPRINLMEGLESLSRRSLVEQNASCFTLQSVVMEYVISNLIEKICQEIINGEIQLFRCYALIKATAKDYVRKTQIRVILQPLIDGLLAIFKCQTNLEEKLTEIVATQRETSPREPGYIGGNIINMFCQMETDLKGYDFSNLTVWQADLRNACLHDVNFQNADLAKSVFAEAFGGVLSVVFSPDGKLLATGDTKGEILLRQVNNGQQVMVCREHNDWVTSVAFSPNGSILASSSTDYTVKLWDLNTKQCLQTLQEHNNEVWSVAFSPDGDILASGCDDQLIRLWYVSTGECFRTFQGHTSWVLSVAFSPDGHTLASGGQDCTIRLWDVSTGECFRTFQGHSNGIRSIAFSPDGQTLASGSEDYTVKLWNVNTEECLKTFQGHFNGIYSVAFSSQGDLLVSGSYDQTVRLWDVSNGQCLKILNGHVSRIWSVAFSPQGNLLVSGSHDQTVRLWSASNGQCLKTFQGNTAQVLSVAFSSDSQTIVSSSQDRTIRLWDLSTGQSAGFFRGHRAAIWSVACSPDAKLLASGSDDRTIRLWDLSTGQSLRTLSGHTNQVLSVAFSPDTQLLASGSEDRTIRLWDLSTGQSVGLFRGHRAVVFSVAFSPQGKMLASGSLDGTVKFWDLQTNACFRTLEGHTSWVWSVAFSPNGKLLASASSDETLKLWNVSTGECFKTLSENIGLLQSVAFSPDSRTIASSTQDYTIKLWDLSTGQCLRILQGHTGRIWSVAYSLDNKTLASGSEDETIRLWDTITGRCLKTLKTDKLYERMNVMGIKGLSETTIDTLKVLGATNG